jgi:hypothetical protein
VCRELSNYIDSINDTVNILSVKLYCFSPFIRDCGDAGKVFSLLPRNFSTPVEARRRV